MVLLWRQLHRNFLRFDNLTIPSGRRRNFYEVARGQHPLFLILLVCALSTESLSCPKSIHVSNVGSIGRSTIFHGQQYSSCSKAGGCLATPLLGGFLRNLLIVSWVTPSPGLTRVQLIFRYLMPPAAYFAPSRSKHVSWIFDVCRQLKKAGYPQSKHGFHSNSTGTKIIRKSNNKKSTFYVSTPCLF
jgi:hypothetical protein